MKLGEVLERTLPSLGYELVDCDHSARSGLVRVFIDKPGRVDVEDCARVSPHLTHLFRRLKGVLRGVEGDAVRLDTETGPRTIAMANIDRARLVPKIEWRNAR